MDTVKESIFKITLNKDNPRLIRDAKFNRLIDSILVFPMMLELRPIVVDAENVVLGGNMRLRALRDIAKMTSADIAARLTKNKGFEDKDERERASLLSFWDEWLTVRTAHVVRASSLTEDEKREFIVKDNAAFGEWDWDVLANDWDNSKLAEWGVDIWDKVDFDDADLFTGEKNEDTRKEVIKVELTGAALDRMVEISDTISNALKCFDGVRML